MFFFFTHETLLFDPHPPLPPLPLARVCVWIGPGYDRRRWSEGKHCWGECHMPFLILGWAVLTVLGIAVQARGGGGCSENNWAVSRGGSVCACDSCSVCRVVCRTSCSSFFRLPLHEELHTHSKARRFSSHAYPSLSKFSYSPDFRATRGATSVQLLPPSQPKNEKILENRIR